MRSIFLIAVLSVLGACDSSSSKKTERCTVNGVDVPCSSLTSPARASRASNRETIVSKVSGPVAINYDAKTIEVLANAENVVTSDDAQGSNRECIASMNAGDVFSFSIVGDRLKLTKDAETVVLYRVTPSNDRLNGAWSHEEVGGGIVMTFQNDSVLEVEITCSM